MSIKVGDRMPRGSLYELALADVKNGGCRLNPVEVNDLLAGKKIVIFGVPGAFTPTCSGRHLPGYIEKADALRAKGIDEVWCVSVNDAFVMAAWGREQSASGKVRMIADGNAEYVRSIGLGLDLRARGMGVRSQRFSMFVLDGVVKIMNVEVPGRFEVSDARTMLNCLSSWDFG